MSRDTLYLLAPGFEDARQPGQTFGCPHCNAIEGLLASFPDDAAAIDVVRVPFPRPRLEVIAAVGEAHQSLPLLLVGTNPPSDAIPSGEVHFIDKSSRILELPTERHGFPRLHG